MLERSDSWSTVRILHSLLAAMCAALAFAAPAAAEGVPAVRASADLAEYVRQTDYPHEALRNREQGVVQFELSIHPNGRVAQCTITGSSGSRALDDATCRIMTNRARFRPARDEEGRPVADKVTTGIAWRLPPDAPPPAENARARANLASYITNGDYPPAALSRGEQGRVEFELDVSEQGRVTYCHIMVSSGSRLLDLRTCQIMLIRARFRPARDAEGNAVPDRVSAAIGWHIM